MKPLQRLFTFFFGWDGEMPPVEPEDDVMPEATAQDWQDSMFIATMDTMAKAVYENSKAHGFWKSGLKRNQAEMVALMHSELSEALEAIRDPGIADKHVPGVMSLEIELADAIIRIMDFAHGFNLRLPEAILAKHRFNLTRPFKHDKKF